jgi:HSP20 family protein
MTNIVKRDNARREPATFGTVVDQVFQNSLNKFFNDDFWGADGTSSLTRNQLPVNIRETDKSYEMEMVAPGFRKNDFRLNINGDMLTVSVEKKEETKEGENNKEGWLRREYRMQSFSRSFTLDDSVDAAKISARYEDGLLHLTLPKKEGAQRISRTIDVQ